MSTLSTLSTLPTLSTLSTLPTLSTLSTLSTRVGRVGNNTPKALIGRDFYALRVAVYVFMLIFAGKCQF